MSPLSDLAMSLRNEAKDKIQRECLNAWYKQACSGTAEIATGVGKTRVGILASEYVVRIIKNSNAKILILTPTQTIRDSAWKDEFAKWGHLDIFEKNVEAVCIQTACKYENQHYDLIIADEIHNYISANKDAIYFKFFEKNTYDKILGLSASIDASLIPKLNQIAPIVYSMDINKAVDLGLVSPFTIINIPVLLTDVERASYDRYNEDFEETFDLFNKDLNFMFKCLKNKKLFQMHLRKHFNLMVASPDDLQAIYKVYENYPYKCNKAMRERKSILYNASRKLHITKALSNLFKDKKGIVFSETSNFADKVQKKLGDICVTEHSKVKPASKRKKNIAKFQDDSTDITRISTVRSLNEGANLTGVEFIIIASGTSKLKGFIQRVGRSIRHEEGKKAIIIRLFVKGSQEEKWMKSSQEGYKVNEVVSHLLVADFINKKK